MAMLIGSGASVFVSVAAYLLFASFYDIPSSQFPVPTAEIWLDMAKLVSPPYHHSYRKMANPVGFTEASLLP